MNVDGSTVFSSVFAECASQTNDAFFNFNLKMVASPSGPFTPGTALITFTWKGWFIVLPTNYLQLQVSVGSQYSAFPSASRCIMFYEVLE